VIAATDDRPPTANRFWLGISLIDSLKESDTRQGPCLSRHARPRWAVPTTTRLREGSPPGALFCSRTGGGPAAPGDQGDRSRRIERFTSGSVGAGGCNSPSYPASRGLIAGSVLLPATDVVPLR
jgi:hypothetical protein